MPEAPASSTRSILITLCATVVLVMAGFGMIAPVLPLYARTLGMNTFMVGVLVSSFGLARMLFSLPAGHLSDRFGRRSLILWGPVILAAASIGFAFSRGMWSMIAFRFIQGVGSAFYTTAANTSLVDVSHQHNRARVIALYQASLLFGAGLGPAVGGLVADLISPQATFLVYAFLSALAALWAYFTIPETQPVASHTKAPEGEAEKTWHLFRDRNFLLVALVTFAVFFTRSGSRMTVIPLVGSVRLGLDGFQIGIALSLMSLFNLITLPWSGTAADRHGPKPVIVPSMATIGCALLLFTWSSGYAFFLVTSVILGIGSGIAGAAPAAYAAELAPSGRIASTVGLYRTIADAGWIAGPLLLGMITDQWGYDQALLTNAVLLICSGAFFGLWATSEPGSRK